MAVYGAVVAPVAERALQRLRRALFGALRTTCHLVTTAAMAAFEQCAVEAPELDPEVMIVAQRLETLRRAWELLPLVEATALRSGKSLC